jgi:hypothetical protein
MAPSSTPLKELSAAFEGALQRAGLHGALRMLNARTPHRFTGVYRYDGPTLRNVGLFDQFNPDAPGGDDAPIDNTFCSLVPGFGGVLAFTEASKDRRVSHVATPVVSYCGVQLFDAEGVPRGTLCHFDLKPCEPQASELQLLQTLAPMLQRTLIEVSAPN